MSSQAPAHPYRRVLSSPHVLALATASVVARLPAGMAAVALVIYVHEQTGSFGAAGAAAGAFTAGIALTGPLLGRLVDRRGPRPILAPAAFLASVGLAGVVALGELGTGAAAMVASAALAGIGMPPIGGLLRGLWPWLVEPPLHVTAFVIDSILIEMFFIVGPLLTGLFAATIGPASALLAAAAFGILGVLWFLANPVIGEVEPTPPQHYTRAGALASPVIRLLVLTGLPLGATFGALDVAGPAFGAAHGSSAIGGPFGAAIALGSALGALVYGASPQRFGDASRVYLGLAVLQPLLVLPLLLAPSIAAWLALGVLAGTFIAPTITARSQIAQLAMPRGTATEAFTWLTLSILVGASAGSALAGPLVEAGGWRVGVALASALPAAGLPLILASRGLLRGAVSQPSPIPISAAAIEGD